MLKRRVKNISVKNIRVIKLVLKMVARKKQPGCCNLRNKSSDVSVQGIFTKTSTIIHSKFENDVISIRRHSFLFIFW